MNRLLMVFVLLCAPPLMAAERYVSSSPTVTAVETVNWTAGVTHTYDGSGHAETFQGHTFTWDAVNMPVRDAGPGTAKEFVYTADDERLAIYSVGSNWNWTVRDLGGRVLREFTSNSTNSSWTWTRDYLCRDGMLLASRHGPGMTSVRKFEIKLRHDTKGVVNDKLSIAFTRVVDGTERQYELTASSVRMLSIRKTDAGLMAAIVGMGTLVDVTSKQSPVTLAENAPLIVTATDAGSPNTSDSVSFTLYKPYGSLWTATGWDGNRAAEQPLQQRSINIKDK